MHARYNLAKNTQFCEMHNNLIERSMTKSKVNDDKEDKQQNSKYQTLKEQSNFKVFVNEMQIISSSLRHIWLVS